MKVLVIPEDPKLDQYILKPVVTRIFADLGKSPRIEVLPEPRLRGVTQALHRDTLADIVAIYPMVDLFLVLVDRDGDAGRQTVADAREGEHLGRLFVSLAVEEVEVWMLALHSRKLPAAWKAIRSEVHPKERFANPFLAERAPKLSAIRRGLHVSWRGLRVTWRGLHVSWRGLRVTWRSLQVTRRGLQASRRGLQETRRGLRVTRRGLRVTRRGLQASRRGLRVTRRGLQASRRGLQVTRRGLQEAWRPLHNTSRRLPGSAR